MTGSKDIWLRGGLGDPEDVALRPDGPDTPHKRGGGFATAIGGGVKQVIIDKTGGGFASLAGGADDYSITPQPPVVEPVPSGGMPISPPQRLRRPRHVVRIYSQLRVRSTYRRRVRVRRRVPVHPSSLGGPSGRRTSSVVSTAEVSTTVRTSARARTIAPVLTQTEVAIARIPEGP